MAGGTVVAATDAQLSARPGVYALGLHLDRSLQLDVGALGKIAFPAGNYLYVGSAWGPGGLAARVQRHLRGGTVRHWHIDALRAVATPVALWLVPESREECAWAQQLLALPGARIPAPRFGASDCRCPTHLIFFETIPPAATLLAGAQLVQLNLNVPTCEGADVGTWTRANV